MKREESDRKSLSFGSTPPFLRVLRSWAPPEWSIHLFTFYIKRAASLGAGFVLLLLFLSEAYPLAFNSEKQVGIEKEEVKQALLKDHSGKDAVAGKEAKASFLRFINIIDKTLSLVSSPANQPP